jgi:hypothetical protein
MNSEFRHLDDLRMTGLDEFSLSLPLGIVLRRLSLQLPGDAFKYGFRIAVPHWILSLCSSLAAMEEWFDTTATSMFETRIVPSGIRGFDVAES